MNPTACTGIHWKPLEYAQEGFCEGSVMQGVEFSGFRRNELSFSRLWVGNQLNLKNMFRNPMKLPYEFTFLIDFE